MAQHQLQLLQIGIVLIFVGIIAIIISLLTGAANEKGSSFKFSVVGFFGFIPFGFGNDKKLLVLTVVIAAVVVAAATIILFSRNLKP